MTTWIRDDRGNKCSVEYFGSEDAAKAALASLKDCENCTNCSDCSDCSGCSGCSDCSGCSRCSNIAYLYNRRDLQGDPDGARKAGPPPVPVISNIHQAVYAAASKPESLVPPMTEVADRRVDDALDKILRAAGSGKLSNYMPYTQDRLREAMREVLEDAAIAKAGGER